MHPRVAVSRLLPVITSGALLGACSLVASIDDITVVEPNGTEEPDASVDEDRDSSVEPDDAGKDAGDAGGNTDASARCDASAPFNAPVAIGALNSAQNDVTATLSPDELTVYFGSDRPGHLGGSSIYTATRPSLAGTFGTPMLVPNVNGPTITVVNPAITGDGLKLYIQVTIGANQPDIYVASRASTATNFATPVLVPNVNTGAADFLPFVSADGKDLYFSSNRAQANVFVLYETNDPGTGFGTPTIIGGIPTGVVPSADTEPVMSADKLTLYFASRRDDAAYHIYVARRAMPSGDFGAPTPVAELNSPIGSGIADLPNWLSPDDCRIYLTRGAATGDLYVATRVQ